MINRLIERSAGTIRVGGREVTEVPPVRLRRGIGYVIQGVGLFPHLTVAENVAILPSLLGWEKDRTRARVEELLRLVRLDPGTYSERMPRELSGGQTQRVGFARAFAASPAAVLLDEPFGALDPITRAELQQEFRGMQAEIGFAGVLVTHDMTEALLLADRVAVMRAGRIVQIGSPRELLNHPADEYVTRLLDGAVRQVDRIGAIASGRDATPA
jgi:osmoprotectant transport system ATP-binding protein